MVKYIINEKWYSEKKGNIEDETERIVITAAKIIRAEIRDTEYNSDSYPTNNDISDIEKRMDTTPLTDTDKNNHFIRTETEQHWTMYCTGN